MFCKIQKSFMVLSAVAALIGVNAHAVQFNLTIRNGSNMPISPAVVYVEQGQKPQVQVGQTPTKGFVRLCQTGHPDIRTQELKSNSNITFVTHTSALLMPGQKETVAVAIENPQAESVHFEAMYGKTKDACSVAAFKISDIAYLATEQYQNSYEHDEVLQTGAFMNANIPNSPANCGTPNFADGGMSTGMGCPVTCDNAKNAVDCLRKISLPTTGKAQVRFFTPYLPSVVNFLESRYGAQQTQALIIPSSGAVQLQLSLD